MRKIFSALILLSLSALVLAANAPGPKQIGKSKVFIAQNWTFDFGETLPPTFTFKTFGFPTTPVHKSRMESGSAYGYAQEKDEFGNLLLDFTFSPKNRLETVVLRSFIDTDYSADQPAGEGSLFLSEGVLTASDSQISAKAREIAGRAKSKLEELALLTGWVHNRINYDGPGYGASVQNASWVFYNRVGTCDEYSHLLISMLRVLQVPSKFVAGFVCSAQCNESRNWGPHAWVEVLVDGKWVSSDPTFNEAILLDATHVKFAEGKDQEDIKEQLSVIAFNFPLKDVKLERSSQVSLDEWGGFPDSFDIELQVPEAIVGENSVETVVARVKSNSERPLAVPLSINTPVEMEVRGEQDVMLFLEAGGEKNHSWNVVTPSELKQGFVYNFTIEVGSLGESSVKHVVAKKGGDTRQIESIRIKELRPVLEETTILIGLDLENTGNKKADAEVRIESNAGNSSKTISIQGGEAKSIEFTFPRIGSAEALAGIVVIALGEQKIVQPFNIRLSLPEPSPPPTPQAAAALSLELVVLIGAVVIVIILGIALFLLRKS